MKVLSAAITVFSVVELTTKLGSLCLDYGKAVKNSSTEINELKEEVAGLEKVANQVRVLLDKPEGQELKLSKSLDDVLKQSHTKLKELEQKLKPKQPDENPDPKHTAKRRKLDPRALKWPFRREEVHGLVQNIRGYNGTISDILQVHQTNLLHKLHLEMILKTLTIANGASFDSHDERNNAVCLPGTRVELLNDIKTWASDPSSKSLYWLNGMAGTGKSTISRTICQQFFESRQLGASFFFKRGEADRGGLSRFVTTLATQVSEKFPDFAESIRMVIDGDKGIVREAPKDQFEKLIKEPLAKVSPGSHKEKFLVFVIDALDECDNDQDIELIINLFSSCAKITNPNMKFKWFITSRPELPIRLSFNTVKGTFQDFILHDIAASVIKRDITAFLKYKLQIIKDRYNGSVAFDRQLPSHSIAFSLAWRRQH
ncbi:uncharacterized protein BROUX77_006395 [Berkeleyomyces rouxiae]|uniref:uncharacterized protein n=1 Tax=Berkeleyomyces rouxiae TaxID=2035830 RepID=UPI003B7FD395